MPVNTAIYDRIARPEIPNLLEAYAQGRQLKMQGENAGLQNRLQQMQLQQAQRQMADNDLLRGAYEAGFDPASGKLDYGKVQAHLAQNNGGSLIPGVSKQASEDSAARMEAATKVLGLQKELSKGVLVSPSLASAMSSLDQMEALTGKGSMDAERQRLTQIGDNPEGITRWAASHAMSAESLLPKVGSRDLGGAVQSTMVDPLTGKTTVVDTAEKVPTFSDKESARHNTAIEAQGQGAQAIQRQNLALSREKLNNDTSAQQANLAIKRQELGIAQNKASNDAADRQNAKAGAVASYDTAIETLSRLANHPGLSAAVGAPNPLQGGFGFGNIPGTPAANFAADLESFKAQTFLPMVQSLRGMGALSDAEGKKLSAAVGALSPSMSEEAFKESIGRIRRDLEAARARSKAGRLVNQDMAPSQGGNSAQHPDDIKSLLLKYGAK